jgi:hypothetical protein
LIEITVTSLRIGVRHKSCSGNRARLYGPSQNRLDSEWNFGCENEPRRQRERINLTCGNRGEVSVLYESRARPCALTAES